MTTLRVLLFSMLAAFLLYLPFYYFAPLYQQIYEHVNIDFVNWWARWSFARHNGIQIYVAYVLMFLAIGLTGCFEYLYLRSISPRVRGLVLVITAAVSFFYLRKIGFCPPGASVALNGQGIIFIVAAIIAAFIFGRFFKYKVVKGVLLVLLFGICMVPGVWSFLSFDYFYLFAPALRTLKGIALSHSYFQYDQCLSFLVMGWIKLGLPLDRFHVLIDFSYLVFFVGIYFMAKNLFFNKQLAFYFIFSLVLIKVYGNLGTLLTCPQVSPVRLDLWLVLLALAFWRGPQHWAVGLTLAIFLNFHHAFGMIYCVSYLCLIAIILVLNRSNITSYLPNICLMIVGELVNRLFVSSDKIMPGLNYVKYNVGFMPIDPKSFFWYVPVFMSMALLLLWKNRAQLPQRYFQTGIFLVFLAIGNLLYFFGRSHDNNLINVAASLWLVFFLLMDLIFYRLPQKFTSTAQKIFIPLIGVCIVGMIAYFYSGQAVDRIKDQVANLPKITELFKPESPVNLDYNAVRVVTQGSPNVVFLSIPHDFEYYYYGGYTPVEFCPLGINLFMKDLMDILNDRIANGAYIIVPKDEFSTLIETILLIKAKHMYRISDFVYISNNQPAI